MRPQPHRNEPRYYAYPCQRLVAVFDDRAAVEHALAHLRGIDVDTSDGYLRTGPGGADLLDRHGQRHGLRGRLLRLLQWTSAENDSLDVHDRARREGRHLLSVAAPDEDPEERIATALLAAGGHHLVYFGRFIAEKGWT